MTSKAKVKALAKTMGCTVVANTNGNWFSVNVDTPDGQCFGPDQHTIVAGCFEGDKQWKSVAWNDVLEELENAALEACGANCSCKY